VSAELASGTVFARDYRIIRVLGSGGMGTVYEVEQLSTAKRRALKLLQNRLGRDEKAHHRFVREATVAARMRSEHVVQVIAAGIDERTSTPWIAMELLDGFDFKRVVDWHSGLGPRWTHAVFKQLCHGLGAAHEAGVIHRDLKPENIFVARTHRAESAFTIKILDFGIAKLTHELTVSTDTGTVGSPLWMSPEQLNALPLSSRSDVWALGLLAFWALTGQTYWKAAHNPRVTVQAVFAEQLFSELEPASVRAASFDVGARIPDGFDAWFSACVQRDPDARFADARAAGAALASVLEPAAATDDGDAALLPPIGQTIPAISRPPLAASTRPRISGIEGTTGGYDGRGFGAPPTDPVIAASGRLPESSVETRAHEGPLPEPTPRPEPRPTPGRPRSEGFGRAHVAIAVAVPAMLVGAVATWLATREPPGQDPTDTDLAVEIGSTGATPTDASHHVSDTGSRSPGGGGVTQLDQADPTRIETVGHDDVADATRVAFMGWTVEGDAFVLQVAYPAGDGAAVSFVEIHDGSTGETTSRYLIEPADAKSRTWPGSLQAWVDEAGTGDDWTRRRLDLLLRRPNPERAPQMDQELRLGHGAVPTGTKVQILPKRKGFDFRWFGFDDASGSTAGLPLHVDHDTPRRRDRLLSVDAPLTYADAVAHAADGHMPTIAGSVTANWSPDESRCVLIVSAALERSASASARDLWFLRAAGPQIEIVDAGAGAAAARKTAMDIDAAKLPVARFAHGSVTHSEIVYATGEAGLAQQLRQSMERQLPTRLDPTLSGLAARIVLGPP
jgi:serine/threonine-protein kinase